MLDVVELSEVADKLLPAMYTVKFIRVTQTAVDCASSRVKWDQREVEQPVYDGDHPGVVYQLVVLDVVVLVQVVGEGFQGGDDHCVTENTSLHAMLLTPVDHQVVLTDAYLVTNRAVTRLAVLTLFVERSQVFIIKVFVTTCHTTSQHPVMK